MKMKKTPVKKVEKPKTTRTVRSVEGGIVGDLKFPVISKPYPCTTIKFKMVVLRDGFLPVKKTKGAAAYDAYASIENTNRYIQINPKHSAKIPLGFKVQIPEGYHLKLVIRSSWAEADLIIKNSPGIIDSDYRGEVCALVNNCGKTILKIDDKTRICQLLLEKTIDSEIEVVNELDSTERGENGFGSTGMT